MRIGIGTPPVRPSESGDGVANPYLSMIDDHVFHGFLTSNCRPVRHRRISLPLVAKASESSYCRKPSSLRWRPLDRSRRTQRFLPATVSRRMASRDLTPSFIPAARVAIDRPLTP